MPSNTAAPLRIIAEPVPARWITQPPMRGPIIFPIWLVEVCNATAVIISSRGNQVCGQGETSGRLHGADATHEEHGYVNVPHNRQI